MPPELEALVAVGIAAGVSAMLMPGMSRLALRNGILDHPGGYKKHLRSTPYLGGIAILAGAIAATLATAGIHSPIPAIAATAIAICALGTLDDWRPIQPGIRIALHAAIGAIVWVVGAGWSLNVPDWANLVLTMGWIVVATNALNLIDNLDGTAAAAAAASALGVAVIALSQSSDAWPAVLAAGVLGSCLGFLPYNLAKPARIFLGDGGSTLLGFLLAVAVMGALPEQPGSISLAAAFLLAGTAILDTAMTLASRWRRGVPAFTGGRDHVTHWILSLVGSARRAAAVVAGAQVGLSALAVAVVELDPPAVPVAAAILLALVVPAGVVVFRGELGSAEPTRAPLPPIERAG
jgi:UDP-N-acetylmuramyl pentapeptide phosphotransferase/UDP-N-acetylglucosamine-1-phosphate transferase